MGFKISTLMISLVFVGLIMAIFGLWISEASQKLDMTYDNQSIGVYNQINQVTELTQKLNNETTRIKQPEGILDIIGGYFTSAYQVLLLSKESVDTTIGVIEVGSDQAIPGEVGMLIKSALIAILLISVIVGIIVTVLLKWEI